MKCRYEPCPRQSAYSSGCCPGHNAQLKRGQSLHDLKVYDPNQGCLFPGCDNNHSYSGYCNGHAQQLDDGRPLSLLRVVRPIYVCSFPGCGRKHEAHGLCASHRFQRNKGWNLRPIRIPNPKESERIRQLNRKVRKRDAPGYATSEQVEARKAFYGYRCAYCGDPAMEIDHCIPLAKGGSGWPANLVPACRHCNAVKNDKSIWEWLFILEEEKV